MMRRLAMAALCGVALFGLGTAPARASTATTPPARAAVAPFATSCPSKFSCKVNYYSDATYTTVVGGYTRPCGGRQVSWGMFTEFPLVIDESSCN